MIVSRLIAVLLAAGCAGVLVGCGGSPDFASGDCVNIRPRLTDHKLVRTTCKHNGILDPGTGFVDENSLTYRVTQVIADGTPGHCSFLADGSTVEFTDEPDRAVYCLAPLY